MPVTRTRAAQRMVIVRGRRLRPPYRVVTRGLSVFLNGHKLFTAEDDAAPRRAGRTRRDRLVASLFDLYNDKHARLPMTRVLPLLERHLQDAIDREEAGLRRFRSAGDRSLVLTFDAGSELTLFLTALPRRGEARQRALGYASALRRSLARPAILALGDGYEISHPIEPGLVARVESALAKPPARREAAVLRAMRGAISRSANGH